MLLLVLFSLSLFLSPYTPPLYCSPSMNLLLLFFLFPCLVPPTITTTYHHHHHRLHCRWAAPGTLVKRVVLTCVATQPLPFAAASCTCDALSSTAEGPCRPSSSVRLEAKTIQKGFSWRQQCWNDFCFLFLCFLFFFLKSHVFYFMTVFLLFVGVDIRHCITVILLYRLFWRVPRTAETNVNAGGMLSLHHPPTRPLLTHTPPLLFSFLFSYDA
jgi:hypothetical protein